MLKLYLSSFWLTLKSSHCQVTSSLEKLDSCILLAFVRNQIDGCFNHMKVVAAGIDLKWFCVRITNSINCLLNITMVLPTLLFIRGKFLFRPKPGETLMDHRFYHDLFPQIVKEISVCSFFIIYNITHYLFAYLVGISVYSIAAFNCYLLTLYSEKVRVCKLDSCRRQL